MLDLFTCNMYNGKTFQARQHSLKRHDYLSFHLILLYVPDLFKVYLPFTLTKIEYSQIPCTP